MNFNSVEEILDFAIANEREAVDFYTEISEQETFSGAKETFLAFAEEEKKHERMLTEFKNNPDKLSRYSYKWVPDMKRSNYMVDMTYEKGMSYVDIMRLAMKKEEKALLLYNELASKTDKDEFINLFKVLSQEEAKHKRYFETQYDDYMAEQGD